MRWKPAGCPGSWRWAVLASTALLLLGTASAQPYAAAGGFGRPQLVAGPGTVAGLAAAVHDGVMQAVWASPDGVWRRPLFDQGAQSVQVAPAGSIRAVSAATAGGDIAVAWLERDLRTGRTRHSLVWRDQTHLLFETNLEVPLVVGAAGGAPWVIAAPRADGQAHVTLYRLSTDGALEEPVVVHSTPLGITGLRVGGVDETFRGPTYVAWLEGQTSSTALGKDSEWYAYVMSPANGAAPVVLGAADAVDLRQAVALGAAPDQDVHALWLTEAGTLELTVLRLSDGDQQTGGVQGSALTVVGRSVFDEAGRPVAISGTDAFWLSDTFIRRGTIDAAGRVGDVVSVAWSPVPIEGAVVVGPDETGQAARASTPGGGSVEPVAAADALTTLAWYGRLQGGGTSAYASDDSVAFVPGLTDRVASAMRWSPWTAWQEAVGQALTAVLAGVTVTVGLSPLMFVLGLVAVRFGVARSRPALVGALVGMVTPVAVLLLVVTRFPVPEVSSGLTVAGLLRGMPWLVIGGVSGLLLARRRDNEAQTITFIAASSAALVATTTLAFVHYHSWAAFIGII